MAPKQGKGKQRNLVEMLAQFRNTHPSQLMHPAATTVETQPMPSIPPTRTSTTSFTSTMSPPPFVPRHQSPPRQVPNGSSNRPRSIRCKETEPNLDGAPLRNTRGICCGIKTRNLVRDTGALIKVDFSRSLNGPEDEQIRSLLVHDIGSYVRKSVPMEAPSYNELDPKNLEDVYDHLREYYELPLENKALWDFVHGTAAERFKDWKFDCRQHWLLYGDEVPLEFVDRTHEWEWLCNHFNTPEHQALCARMKAIRNSKKRMNHRSGQVAFSYRTKRHQAKGHVAPPVATLEDVYAGDPVGQPLLAKVKERLNAMLEERAIEEPEVSTLEPLPVAPQLNIIEEIMGRRRGMDIQGARRSTQQCQTSPSHRSGINRSPGVIVLEERVRDAEKAAEAAQEEVAAYKAEMAGYVEKVASYEERMLKMVLLMAR